ncbi:cobalamin biosynthesis protein [Pseudomonas sp. GCM10022188]|uniref:cobalamin biosynthesis protein n=1 Tax=Pseudomonas TaxID=286 RepID=UPI001E618844|nr:cobalamin biosynthesis protein [Pseudomonas oryzagri]MCC6077179.1 cobalamin biosynthesis protein [Pseudomonas oryzagri]
MSVRHIVGLGCRRGCSMGELLDLLEQTLRQQGLQLADLDGLASSAHKAGEAGLQELAEHLRLPLALLSAEQLARYHERLSRHSVLSLRITGSAGVAEASALAHAEALGGGRVELLCARRSSARATLAIARTRFEEHA